MDRELREAVDHNQAIEEHQGSSIEIEPSIADRIMNALILTACILLAAGIVALFFYWGK